MTGPIVASEHSIPPLAKRNHMSALALMANGAGCLFLTEFLAQLEEKTATQTRDLFDVIAGTSSGALVAAALSQGIPASEIGEAFARYASNIYRKHPFPLSLTGNWFKSSYDPKALREFVTSLLCKDSAQLTMDKVEGKLLLPLWDLGRHEQYDLATKSLTPNQIDASASGAVMLGDAVMASMATPGHFEEVIVGDRKLIDASLIVSPVTRLYSTFVNSGMENSALNILSLRAARSNTSGKKANYSNQKFSDLFSNLRTHKAVFDIMPERAARKAAVDARDRLGDRFQEYSLELEGDLEFQPESYLQEDLEAIKKAARHEFERFISGDNWDRFQKKIS